MKLQEKTVLIILILLILMIIVTLVSIFFSFVSISSYKYFLLILGTDLFFGVAILVILDRFILSRIRSISQQVHDIDWQTQLSRRVSIEDKDEFSDLAKEINRMLETIERTQNVLIDSEARFRDLAELLPQTIFEMDIQGCLTFVNHTGTEIFGIDNTKIQNGAKVSEYLIPEDLERMQKGVARVISGEKSIGEVYHLKRSDGTVMSAIVFTGPILRNGSVIGLRGIVNDISERKRMEDALRENERKYRLLADNATDIIWTLDLATGKFTYFSPSVEKIRGYTPEEALNIPLDKTLTPESYARAKAELTETLAVDKLHLVEHDRIRLLEFQEICKDGSIITTESQMKFIRNSEGVPISIQGISRDITERKRMEDSLREREEKFRTLFNSADDAIYIHEMMPDNTPGAFLEVNDTLCNRLGYTREELLGMSIRDIVSDKHRLKIPEFSQQLAEKGSATFYGEHKKKDGSVFPVEINSHRFTFSGREITLVVARDVTERKKMEDAIHESEEKYRALTENTPDILFSTDISGIMTYASPQINKYGFREEDVIGKPFHFFIHPADIAAVENNMARELEKGEQFISRFRLLDKMGNVFWFDEKSSLRHDRNGKPIGMYGVLRDVTERKHIEDAIEIGNKKLNLMNQITRHDILNTITGVLGCVDMANATTNPEEKQQLLQDIKDLTRVIQRHISFTREYQEVGIHLPQWHDVNDLLKKTFQNFDKSGITISSKVNEIEIYADPMLEKVFYNLIDNAIRYGVTLTTISIYPVVSNKELLLVFEDNGVGVEPGLKREIFKRGVGKNTGMGLFLTSEILSITGITIEENGQFGKGARFEIRIPNGIWRR